MNVNSFFSLNETDEIRIKLKILIDLLNKKIELLNQVIAINENRDMFVRTLRGKDMEIMLSAAANEEKCIIDEIMRIDSVFLSTFEKFNGNLNKNKVFFKEEIRKLQENIKTITDINVKIKIRDFNSRKGTKIINSGLIRTFNGQQPD